MRLFFHCLILVGHLLNLGGFVLPKKMPIELDPKTHDRIWKMAPSPQRQNNRSKTPVGFSRALFEKYSK